MLTNAFLIMALLLSLLLPVSDAAAAAKTLAVPGNYASIQSAVNAAANDPTNSYTITVAPGSYSGDIQITAHPNSLTIAGTETAATAITGGSTGRLITVSNNTKGSIVIQRLLFRGAADGVTVTNNAAPVKVANSIFAVGIANAGVVVQNSASASVENCTFFQNRIGVSRSLATERIINNIFSGNLTDIVQSFADQSGISNNLFDPALPAGSLTGINSQPTGTFASDPRFVNTGLYDFHLRAGSPAIDTGDTIVGTDSVDGSAPDIGAYGGPGADTIPFRVQGVTLVSASASTVTLSWTAEADYRVIGYRVHYGYSSGVYTGTGAAQGNSPVDVGNVASAVLTGLTGTVAAPAAPAMGPPVPGDGRLTLSWSAVPGAASYNLYYGVLSVTENIVSVGNVTSVTLAGLTNGQTYFIAVSAVATPTLSIAATAYNSLTGTRVPGASFESVYVGTSAVIGTPTEGLRSTSVTGMPEPVTAYPDLRNPGCFIATAAHGSPDAPAVLVLRRFRDHWLLTNRPGRTFVAWYYRVSPGLAARLNDHASLKPLVRVALAPIVAGALLLDAPPVLQVMLLALVSCFLIHRQRKTA